MSPVLFFAGYLALMAVTIAVWLAVPTAALSGFILMSWFHFGTGDAGRQRNGARHRRAHGIATGGLILASPLVMYRGESAMLLADVTGRSGATAERLLTMGSVIAVVAVLAAVVAAFDAWKASDRAALLELAAVAALGVATDPLIGFSLYFALIHAPRHLDDMQASRRDLLLAGGATGATVVGAAAIWWWSEPSAGTALRVVFIALSALTTPHLITTWWARRGGRDRGIAAFDAEVTRLSEVPDEQRRVVTVA